MRRGLRRAGRLTRRLLLLALVLGVGTGAVLALAERRQARPLLAEEEVGGGGRRTSVQSSSRMGADAPTPAEAPRGPAAVAAGAPLTAELASLRAAVAAETARLEALEEARADLLGALDALRTEVAGLQRTRDAVARGPAADTTGASLPEGPAPRVPPRPGIASAKVAGGPSAAPAAALLTVAAIGALPPTSPESRGEADAAPRTEEPVQGAEDAAAGKDDAPPPPPPLPLPEAAMRGGGGGAPSVTIHRRAGSAAAQRAAALVAEEVRRAGLAVAGTREEPAVPADRQIRPATAAEDGGQAVAERLAARFRRRWGHVWHVAETAAAAELPAEERTVSARLEIWLPHR